MFDGGGAAGGRWGGEGEEGYFGVLIAHVYCFKRDREEGDGGVGKRGKNGAERRNCQRRWMYIADFVWNILV